MNCVTFCHHIRNHGSLHPLYRILIWSNGRFVIQECMASVVPGFVTGESAETNPESASRLLQKMHSKVQFEVKSVYVI